MKINPAPYITNISNIRKNPTKIIRDSHGEMIAIMNHGDVISYLISPEMVEEFLEVKSDKEALTRIDKMDLTEAVEVDLDEL
jgi:antitoxin StbD